MLCVCVYVQDSGWNHHSSSVGRNSAEDPDITSSQTVGKPLSSNARSHPRAEHLSTPNSQDRRARHGEWGGVGWALFEMMCALFPFFRIKPCPQSREWACKWWEAT